MARRITLEEIARESGVSLATVSLVLRDKPGVNAETRRRVLETARDLGYRKKRSTEQASQKDIQQIGVVMKARADDIPQSNPFYSPVLAGIEFVCRKQHINLLYATVPVDAENHVAELPRILQEQAMDGMLLVGTFVDTTLAQIIHHDAQPIVLVDAYIAENGYDSVITDNFAGAYQAVSYLIDKGHRDIGLVASLPHSYPSISERRRGYIQALADRGIAACYFADSHLRRADAAEATLQLLEDSPHITALFCCNDDTAIGVLQALQSAGRRVPEDISLIGFDDTDPAAYVVPALTTMQVDKVGLGRIAVQLLMNRIEMPDAGLVTSIIRPLLIERQSVQGPRPA